MQKVGGIMFGVGLRLTVMPLAFALAACATTGAPDAPDTHAATTPEARAFVPGTDASAEVEAALTTAAQDDTRMLLVMGANWCHDSRALAGWLGTERFQQLIEEHFELVYVNIGMPQTGDGHNLDIAQRFGLADLPGTPNLLVVTPEGILVNPDTATTWRNAASRSEDAIYEELVELAHRPA